MTTQHAPMPHTPLPRVPGTRREEPSVARRRIRQTGVATLALAMLSIAGPAIAHPFIHSGEVPVDSLATITLDIAHGCDPTHSGEQRPTTEVAIELPGWVTLVDPGQPDGWEIEISADQDAEVVTYSRDDAQEPAPVFDLDVVVEGEPGQERFLSVYQGCGDAEHRWIGTPDEPADEPAIGLLLVEADPDSPPPDDADDADDTPLGEDDDRQDRPEDSDQTGGDAAGESRDASDDGAADDPEAADGTGESDDVDGDDFTPATDPASSQDDSPGGGLLVGLMIAVVAAAAGFFLVRRRIGA